jgi:hypothetical protein
LIDARSFFAEEQEKRQVEKEATRRALEETRRAAAVHLTAKLNELLTTKEAAHHALTVNSSFVVEELKSLLTSISVPFANAGKKPALIALLLDRWSCATLEGAAAAVAPT